MKKIINVLSGVVAVAAVLSSGLANAKANVNSDSYKAPYSCYDSYMFKYCSSSESKWHSVSTPSGNKMYSGSTTTVYEYWYQGEMVYGSSASQDWRYMYKKGDLHLIKSSISRDDSFSMAGTDYCVSNTSNSDYQYVNGKIIRSSYNVSMASC
ncbi:MAG: hypothetical protein OEY19_00725 [Gammaproteobacteria bacterium]|nr:hypothetical protein [Gammaproteobacteria bacterium]MDH5628693.1 hypothetical protein [Gammaproteobacteria bacterium]